MLREFLSRYLPGAWLARTLSLLRLFSPMIREELEDEYTPSALVLFQVWLMLMIRMDGTLLVDRKLVREPELNEVLIVVRAARESLQQSNNADLTYYFKNSLDLLEALLSFLVEGVALPEEFIEAELPPFPQIRLGRRLYWTETRQTLVEEGDLRARSLAYGAGACITIGDLADVEVPDVLAAQLMLIQAKHEQACHVVRQTIERFRGEAIDTKTKDLS